MRQLLAVLIISLAWATLADAGTAFYDPIYGVSTTSNIVYGTGAINGGAGTLNLLLDLYRPTNIGQGALPALSPGIVLIHGGGFVSGSKSDLAALAQTYTTYGYTVTSINYRMSGDNPPPSSGPADTMISPAPPFVQLSQPQSGYVINAAVADANTAMGWMRDNAATYSVDTNHIAIGGGSAGAITSLLQAYSNPPAHTAPQAVLNFLGAMYGTEGMIGSGEPPAFNVASSNDTTVPFAAPLGTQATVTQMNAVGVYNEFYVQTIGHNVDFNAMFGGQTLLKHNMDFLAAHLVPEPSTFLLAALAAVAMLALATRTSKRSAPSRP
jgi:acetyl esterase/lipase